MRKLLIPLLVASVMLPSAASARERESGDDGRSKAERSQRDRPSVDGPQRAERSQSGGRDERPARVERVERPARVERVQRAEREPRAVRQVERTEPVRQVRRIQRSEPVQQVRQVEQVAPSQRVVRPERSGNAVLDGLREQARRDQSGWGDRDRDRDGRDWSRHDDDRRWSGDWRHDRRYNWSHHRNRYGSLYRLGRYYDPYGWGYRRWSIGFSLWPSYYGSNYWLNDPWMYRLPPAYGPYRWVRYYDDALLVDIYTGMVVDVIHNFFW